MSIWQSPEFEYEMEKRESVKKDLLKFGKKVDILSN